MYVKKLFTLETRQLKLISFQKVLFQQQQQQQQQQNNITQEGEQ